MRTRTGWMLLLALAAFLIGYRVVHHRFSSDPPRSTVSAPATRPKMIAPALDPALVSRHAEREPDKPRDREAQAAGAVENERILMFRDQEALAAFLRRAGDQIRILGRLDALHALRVGFDDPDTLAALLGSDVEELFVFAIRTPTLPDGSVQPGAMALGSHLLDWLGVPGDNSTWGRGLTIAVLDTGIDPSAPFAANLRSINLVALPDDLSTLNPHGTAVASMIFGNSDLTPGVAPGANPLSIRIAGEDGMTNAFLIAQGIIAAADAGASLINLSYFSESTSPLIDAAIDYAWSKGALVVVPAGNNGLDIANGIAHNDKAIVVGSVDPTNEHLNFSNSSRRVDLAAPGFGINATWTNGQAMIVSGTSFSAPIVTGTLAAIMTEFESGKLSAPQASSIMNNYLNDTGLEGKDPKTGAGTPDLWRVLNADTPGLYDAAVASFTMLQPDTQWPNGRLAVLVQNLGTEPLVNTSLEVFNGSSNTSVNITSLAVGATTTIYVPVTQSVASSPVPIQTSATLAISGGRTDVRPANNSRSSTYSSVSSQ